MRSSRAAIRATNRASPPRRGEESRHLGDAPSALEVRHGAKRVSTAARQGLAAGSAADRSSYAASPSQSDAGRPVSAASRPGRNHSARVCCTRRARACSAAPGAAGRRRRSRDGGCLAQRPQVARQVALLNLEVVAATGRRRREAAKGVEVTRESASRPGSLKRGGRSITTERGHEPARRLLDAPFLRNCDRPVGLLSPPAYRPWRSWATTRTCRCSPCSFPHSAVGIGIFLLIQAWILQRAYRSRAAACGGDPGGGG